MNTVLLLPALAFLVVLVIFLLQLLLMSRVAWRGKSDAPGKCKAYACGEDVPDHKINPDYSQFFPFAFFFTIMHVLALVVATVPAGSLSATAVGVIPAFCISVRWARPM